MGASLSSWTQTVLTDRLARNNKKHDSVLKIVTNGKTVISRAHVVPPTQYWIQKNPLVKAVLMIPWDLSGPYHQVVKNLKILF